MKMMQVIDILSLSKKYRTQLLEMYNYPSPGTYLEHNMLPNFVECSSGEEAEQLWALALELRGLGASAPVILIKF